MASLMGIEDIRVIVLYNNNKDMLIYNRGYQKEPDALIFQRYSIDSENGILTFYDLHRNDRDSHLLYLSMTKSPVIGVLELCAKDSARSGFLINNVTINSYSGEFTPRVGYKASKLVCQGEYRVLSNSELTRGSRHPVTEA